MAMYILDSFPAWANNTHSASYSPARRQLANLHPTFNMEVL